MEDHNYIDSFHPMPDSIFKEFYRTVDELERIDHKIATMDPVVLRQRVNKLMFGEYRYFMPPDPDKAFDETLRQIRERESRRVQKL